MKVFRRRRLVFIAAFSLALHAVVLVWLAWPTSPNLLVAGSDLSLMSVELMKPPSPSASPSPARKPAATHPVAASARPTVARPAQAEAMVSPPPGVVAVPAPASTGQAVPDALRAALRTGGGGCTRPMSREAREACEEKLGRLRAGAPSYDAPMDPGKRAYYDAVVAAGPSGGTYGDPKPGAATPDADYFRVLNCSIKFGAGKKPKGRQGEVRLGRTPCSIPLQGSVFTPEAGVRKR
jgi:hypothetical protein